MVFLLYSTIRRQNIDQQLDLYLHSRVRIVVNACLVPIRYQILRGVFEIFNCNLLRCIFVLFEPTVKSTATTMGMLLEVAVLIAASLGIYARMIGATYLTVALVLISSSAVQLALFLAYHSLIHRWFVAPTKSLPHPKVRSYSSGAKFLLPSG